MMPDLSVVNQAMTGPCQFQACIVLRSSTIKKTGYYNTKPMRKSVL